MSDLLDPFTRSDPEKNALIWRVLGKEMPEHRAGEYSKPEVLEWSFTSEDTARFAVLTNATLANDLTATVVGEDVIVETCPLDKHAGQLAMAKLSYDGNLDGATFVFDIRPDGAETDATVGSFLNASQSVSMTWDAEILLDIYPTNWVTLRFKIVGATENTKIRAVRATLLMIGDRAVLTRDMEAIALFAAARVYERNANEAATQAARQETARQFRETVNSYRRQALGDLGVNGQKKDIPVSGIGGKTKKPYGSAAWDRFKTTLIPK